MKILKATYPNVECDAHPGEQEPGYIVCQHIFAGIPVGHLKRATDKSLGVCCCAACHLRSNEEAFVVKTFVLSCAQGLREQGLLASA